MGTTPLDDAQELKWLVDAFLSGDPEIHRVTRNRLTRFVGQHFNAEQAEREDLVSEVISILLIGLRGGRFRGATIKAFNGYLYGIARLVIAQHVEKSSRRQVLGQQFGWGGATASNSSNPGEAVANSDLIVRIHGQLSEACRELLQFKFLQDWSDQQIADHKQMTKNAISTAISRCLEKARKLPAVQEFLYEIRRRPDPERRGQE